MKLIKPHGGTLINREIQGSEREELVRKATTLPKVQLSSRQVSDLLMLAIGGYSPLDGFLNEADYTSVRDRMKLVNGVVWPIPITLAVSTDEAGGLRVPSEISLYDDDHLLGILHVTEKFTYDKEREAQAVYGTKDRAHPGVASLLAQGDWLLAGPISLLNRPRNPSFQQYRLDPSETRSVFSKRG